MSSLSDRKSPEEWARLRTSRPRLHLGVVLAFGLVPSIVAAGIVGTVAHWQGIIIVGGVVALDLTLVATLVIGRLVQDRYRRTIPAKLGVPLVVVIYAGVAVGLSMLRGDNTQHCVDETTMTVVSPDNCQTTSDVTPYAWYYGGSGSQVGQVTDGGSFSSDSDGTDGGGSGDVDGGDDGGADAGGGEGDG